MPPRAASLLLLALLLAGCADPPPTTIDGSSPEAFAASTSAAREELPVADRLMFDRALASVPARRYSSGDPEQLRRTTFDGMTAAQVVDDQRRRSR
ncbi:hypothetical protein GCM10022280_23630 [Sphingomonas swuensis]|uniref:Uncharacterized protein n=1 Tax=Sphingomonas swuensis TaxID=977800 RepID=A0ABP7T7P4_9SPHN